MSIRILYIEDEIFLGKIVSESLESRGFIIKMVHDGDLVIPAYRTFQPSICIMDVMLPNMDGFTLAEQIRKTDSSMPIIFVTAKTQTEDVIRGFRSGGNDYIRKPFSIEELIIRIENLTSKKSRQEPEEKQIIPLGRFIFNCNHQTLMIDSFEKKLSFRECELLKTLYLNRDRIIDRKEVLILLWGSDNFFNSRNLDVYITKLRSYLKEDPKLEILTIKGVGYRFLIK